MSKIMVCPKCEGQGCVMVRVDHGRIGVGYDYAECKTCKGTGLVKEIITYESYEPRKI